MRPRTSAHIDHRVCVPDLLVDDEARAAANLAGVNPLLRVPGRDELMAAVEDYDLASARLEWAQDCHCQLGLAQRDAIGWHARNRQDAHLAMLATLHQFKGEPIEPRG
jgi:hypothetical protein